MDAIPEGDGSAGGGGGGREGAVVLICFRVADTSVLLVAENSRIDRCADCREEIWVTAASRIAAGATARLLCDVCAGEEMYAAMKRGQHISLQLPTPGQIHELEDRLGR